MPTITGTPQPHSTGAAATANRPVPPGTHSPVPTIGLSTPPAPPLVPSPPTLASVGLTVNPLTQQLSLSRNAQPLCGALLDNKYLLIGTTAGLDFLPLPLPGSLPMKHHGLKKRRETRKPIALIKRTRFKELAILNERSNILLAIAGRNDHVRVYALDGIRAMIERKMGEIDIKDGYPIIQDAVIFDSATPQTHSSAAKGKQRAEASDANSFSHDGPHTTLPGPSQLAPNSSYQFPSTTTSDSQAPTPRRRPSLAQGRPPSWHRLSNPRYSAVSPASPIRISGRQTPSSTSIVHTLPTATPRTSISSQATMRTIRPEKSRDFVAGRRGSTATMQRRYSRADGGATSPARRSSAPLLHSRKASIRSSGRKGSADRVIDVPPVPVRRFEPRAPVKPLNALERSPTSDLAEFLATTGPDLDSPELDRVLASTRERRRSSVTERVPQTEKDTQHFPATKRSAGSTAASSHAAGLAAFGAKVNSTFVEHLDTRDTGSAEEAQAVPPPPPPKPQPRRPSTALLAPGQKSPSMRLAEWISQTGPESDQGMADPQLLRPDLSSGFRDPFRNERASSNSPRIPSTSSSPTSGSTSRFTARSPVVSSGLGSSEGASASPQGMELTLAEIIRDGPPPSPSMGNASPGSRASKRWSISGVGAKLLNNGSSKHVNRSGERLSADSARSSNGWALVSEPEPDQPVAMPQPLAPQSLPFPASSTPQDNPSLVGRPAGEQKRRPLSSVSNGEPLVVPASAQVPPPLDAHPANSPVEYVKLARTRGARLLRAVETKKRTYLAVLCGEEGERIELFTGSRSISLSLNRTFVLPETPKTIEFQLQGDDLVDICLVYGESIFALEPATVRVREVGVGRSERRARRERERRMRELAASTRVDPAAEQADELASSGLHAALHPADHVLRETEEASARAAAGRSRSPSPVPQAEPAAALDRDESLPPQYTPGESDYTDTQSQPAPALLTNAAPDDEGATFSNKPSEPYTSFQQLPFVPPVPSSVLSSAYTIPPLYTDVVGPAKPPFDLSIPQPSITVTQDNEADEADVSPPPPSNEYDLPLLSPISLLGGQRQTGPPGLFFVSKGASLTGIVTADGKSVIKRPLVWGSDCPLVEGGTDGMQRIEVLVLDGKRTAVVRVSPLDVKVISVDGASPSQPFAPAIPVSLARSRPRIQFLATHAAGQQLVYSQTVGSAYAIFCLGPSALS
ncbi:mitogen-activated protein kinase kinase kinase kinase 4-like protein [Rhodotorula toruloides]|uniref:Mitogen-activated protein kinase kinase kinase kinase 4-like protein n=1 Tax=Rhodotorula toruloides TaxID=5286 RepID=A0A511K7E2_RHOTO|nr:mitogen-activated protein kinase kinase kinase kinase 4-like protein [Rhodotorula toruloides]